MYPQYPIAHQPTVVFQYPVTFILHLTLLKLDVYGTPNSTLRFYV